MRENDTIIVAIVDFYIFRQFVIRSNGRADDCWKLNNEHGIRSLYWNFFSFFSFFSDNDVSIRISHS